MKRPRTLAALPAWQHEIRRFNRADAAPLALPPAEAYYADRWGIVLSAAAVGLLVGIVGTTLVWSAQADRIIAERAQRAGVADVVRPWTR